jgi:hypothetical protein
MMTVRDRLKTINASVVLLAHGLANVGEEEHGIDRESVLYALEVQATALIDEVYLLKEALTTAVVTAAPAPTDEERNRCRVECAMTCHPRGMAVAGGDDEKEGRS